VFTGVSGSGKSSLVFGTLASESQRLINETYSAFVQGFMPALARPEVDVLEGLTPAILVDQERMGTHARSTVGTATDANAMLRVLWSRLGEPHIGSSQAFSFNVPSVHAVGKITIEKGEGAARTEARAFSVSGGMCPRCEGMGSVSDFDLSRLYKDLDAKPPHIRAFVERVVTFSPCPDCGGTRLNERARSSRIRGIHIADACAMQISDLAAWVRDLREPSVAPLLASLGRTLESFVEIGLGYLSLDRPSATLSGGEAQRTRMIRHLGSSLTDVTCIFDEPTIGLHPHDIQRMNALLLRLRDKGNTVLLVEHKPEVIAIADHVVDLGPGAGHDGGRIMFEGPPADLVAARTTLTGQHLAAYVGGGPGATTSR
jgi:excinuclease UvrABC ATPase subunit